MHQLAEETVAGLTEIYPDFARPAGPVSDDARLFTKGGCLRLELQVGADKLSEIRDFLNSRPVQYQDEEHNPIGNGLAADAPDTAFIGYHDFRDVVSCPHLVDIANDPRILDVVRGYLGFEPIIDTYLAWHSYAGRKFAGSPQTLHRDKDCFRFCKLFLYLTDVDEEAGPHVFLPSSHIPERFAMIYKAATSDGLNPMQFFSGGQRNHAPYLESVFAGKFERFVGPAGSAFLVNTYGLHKGEPPKTKNRMLFQALYTLLPYSDVMGGITEPLAIHDLPITAEITPQFRYRNQLHMR